MRYSIKTQTPIGTVTIVEQDLAIVALCFEHEPDSGDTCENPTPLLTRADEQLCEYFRGQRKTFDLPLRPKGTEFQRSVYDALISIPFGETRSYRQIAEIVGRPKAFRAVGGANHCNPIPLFIPCHRVIGSDGSMTGFASGIDIKLQLLKLEGYDV